MKTKQTKTFRQQILSMTAGQIIMSMVKGLEKPATRIDMDSYGDSIVNICYGCAATNTVCRIAKVKFKPNVIDSRITRAKTINSTESFLQLFEWAINELRQGNIEGYNGYATMGKFRRIQNPNNLELPVLSNDYTQEQLNVYKKLAKAQRK